MFSRCFVHSVLRRDELPGDLGVAVSGRYRPEQLPLARGEFGGAGPASLGVLVDSVQVGAQQFDQELVPLAEAAAAAAQEQAVGSAGRGGAEQATISSSTL